MFVFALALAFAFAFAFPLRLLLLLLLCQAPIAQLTMIFLPYCRLEPLACRIADGDVGKGVVPAGGDYEGGEKVPEGMRGG